MDFSGKVCPYCKTEFKSDDEVVICSICEMPHHKSCWIENKACTTFGCTGTISGINQFSENLGGNSFCQQCGFPFNEGQRFCSSCGTMIAQEQMQSQYSQSTDYQTIQRNQFR